MLLTVVGLHVPVTPLPEVAGNVGAVAPLQILVAKLNVGVSIGFTVTLILTGFAQTPELGVNV